MYYQELSARLRKLAGACDEGLPQRVAQQVLADLATELDLSIRETDRDSRWELISDLHTQRIDKGLRGSNL